MISYRPSSRRERFLRRVRQVPPPPVHDAPTASLTRFIPGEELADFAHWSPAAFADPAVLPIQRGGAIQPFASDSPPPGTASADAAANPAASTPASAAAPTPLAAGDPLATDASAPAPAPPEPTDLRQLLLAAARAELQAEFDQRLATDTAAAAQAARHQGYQDGYRDGLVALESFKESHARQAATQVARLVLAFDDELEALEQGLAAGVARTATELARQVVRSELTQRPALVAQVAREAVEAMLRSARQITVLLHPDDHALVAAGCADTLAARGARLQTRPDIERGGCRVESDSGVVDASVASRWAQATQALGDDVAWSGGGDAQ